MLDCWQHVRFVACSFRARHRRIRCGVFGGQSSPLQRECHGAPCAFNKVLLHNSCCGDEVYLRCFTTVRRRTTAAVCTRTFGYVTAMSTLSVARLLIILPSWRHFRLGLPTRRYT